MSKRTADDIAALGNDELTRLKAVTADDRYDWMCPICMSPYDNQYRVPMAVSECYAKKRNPYVENEDDAARGRADGCGHNVCEVCSLLMLEKHMQCAVCRSNIKDFAANTVLLAEIVAFAEGQYVSMTAQYNEASTRLEPALMDLKKLQDDMAPAMKEAQEARERTEKLQAEVNTLKGAAASRDMYQKLYEEEKKKSETIPALDDAIDKLRRDLYSLAEEVIYVRVDMVALGSIDPEHVGLSQTEKALVVEGGPVNDRTCRVEIPMPTFPSKQMTKAIHQIKVINETEHGEVADTAPSDPRQVDKDVITAVGREGGERVFIRVGSWTDRFLREGTGFAERIMDGPDNNNPESGHYFRMVSVHSIKEAKLASEVFTAKKREQAELASRMSERRTAAMERIKNQARQLTYEPFNVCIDCAGKVEIELHVRCKECAGVRCDACFNDQSMHACRIGSQTNKYGMSCTSGVVAWELYVLACKRHLAMDSEAIMRFYIDYLFATEASEISSDRVDVDLRIDVDDMNAVVLAFGKIYKNNRMAASNPVNLMKAREFIIDHMPKKFAHVHTTTTREALGLLSNHIGLFRSGPASCIACRHCLNDHRDEDTNSLECNGDLLPEEWLIKFGHVCGCDEHVIKGIIIEALERTNVLVRLRTAVELAAFDDADFFESYYDHAREYERTDYEGMVHKYAQKHSFKMPSSCIPVTMAAVRKVVGDAVLQAVLFKAPPMDDIAHIRTMFGLLRAMVRSSGGGNRMTMHINNLASEAESEYEVSRNRAKRTNKLKEVYRDSNGM